MSGRDAPLSVTRRALKWKGKRQRRRGIRPGDTSVPSGHSGTLEVNSLPWSPCIQPPSKLASLGFPCQKTLTASSLLSGSLQWGN